MKLENYIDEFGQDSFEFSLDTLTLRQRARVQTQRKRMEVGNFGDVKPIGEGVSETRIHAEGGLRIYHKADGDEIVVLFVAGDKKSQRKDITKALSLSKDHERRKNQTNPSVG